MIWDTATARNSMGKGLAVAPQGALHIPATSSCAPCSGSQTTAPKYSPRTHSWSPSWTCTPRTPIGLLPPGSPGSPCTYPDSWYSQQPRPGVFFMPVASSPPGFQNRPLMASVDHERPGAEGFMTGAVSRAQARSKLSSVPGDAHGQKTSGNGAGRCRSKAAVGSERAAGGSLGQLSSSHSL